MSAVDIVLSIVTMLVAVAAIAISVWSVLHSASREQQTWRRDQLLDACVIFLNESFQRYSSTAFDQIFGFDPTTGHNISKRASEKYEQRAKSALRTQNDAMARIRMLAEADVVEAAEALDVADRDVDQRMKFPRRSNEVWDVINADRLQARTRFMSAYRASIGLGKAQPLTSRTSTRA